ncbi:MAG TPA: sugar-transfer associated ATP-grasp domain-containing protein [Dongiaceae bacterium]|jgi:hypothetical protein|nr:sugar-transfer associated ATP-grasp domain-containing protein [Dongiaceae bacterium]
MRDKSIPPPRLFRSSDPATAPAARRVHEICNAAAWRSAGLARQVRYAALALLWPFIAAGMSLRWLRRNAAAIRALTGKGTARQFAEILGLAVAHHVTPKYYYMFELYLDERRAKAGDYLMRYETKEVAYRLLKPADGSSGTAIKNKLQFPDFCRAHGLPAVALIAAFEKGRRIGGDGPLPETDLFIKRVFGKGGARAERWNWTGTHYRSTRGEECDAAVLLEHVAALSQREAYLIQPAVSNHPDLADLTVGALATVRLLTCRDERGGYEVTNASFRTSINPKSPVDNIHAGGIAAPVDLATGRLGQASDLGRGPRFQWYDRHPLTGGRIAGRVLPFWPEAMALAARAHAAFGEWAVIGWDVAILADGPCLIEGNKGPDVDLIQRPLRAPIGSGRFGALLAWNLERSPFMQAGR